MAIRRPGTLRSQWLGAQLRELRDAQGILIKEAAEYLQRDSATLSRYETGFYPIRRPDLLALLDLYGVSSKQRREALLQLSEDVWQKGWWDGYTDDVAGTLIDYMWIEARATNIRSYSAIVIPGLLQTPAYAEKLLRINEADASSEQIERWHELRMNRQQVLVRDEPVHMSAVLDESVLRRQVSDTATMGAQLQHLVTRSSSSNIQLRVVPLRGRSPATTYGTFQLFDLPDPFPEIAYSETLAGGIYIEHPDAARFRRVYDEITELALGPAESVELISTIAEEWQ